MALPKGLIKQATGTVPERAKEETVESESIIPIVATVHEDLEIQPAVHAAPMAASPRHSYVPRKIKKQKAKRPPKGRVHYTLDQELIEFAEEAWRSFQRVDGTRLKSASDYVNELLRLTRDRA